VAQAVECWPTKHKALSSNPSIPWKKKKDIEELGVETPLCATVGREVDSRKTHSQCPPSKMDVFSHPVQSQSAAAKLHCHTPWKFQNS
jgi:hypothetical protein